MNAYSRILHREGVRIGFVPTMGALHQGHRALIRTARLACDAVVASIFVNPTQFGPREDFLRYPRQLKQDAAMCREEGVDLLFVPSRDAMYPRGFQTAVAVHALSQRWEGAHRPTHFGGVATVVTKLLNIVHPHTTFFGQKDYQQVAVVRRLVADLNIGTAVMQCPTVREPDGLAMSSRNAYLTAAQRRAAPILYEALQAGETAIHEGSRDATRIRRAMLMKLAEEPLVHVEYMSVCDPDSLEPLTRMTGKVVLLGAIRLGLVRLIDNLLVKGRAKSRNRKSR
ncbi:MAG: pantoate--beta-alanine ligase [Nitrospirota bacterium]|nr:pantoate--beta-alanine ligase [Nitrospirota bacterium]